MENIDKYKKMIAFDLDGTLFTETKWPGFGESIEENINFVRKLSEANVPIAICTARIYQDKSMEEKTIEELKKRNVPCDELTCEKKPYFVIYVDDRAEKVENSKPWSEENKKNILNVVEKYKMNEKPIEAKLTRAQIDQFLSTNKIVQMWYNKTAIVPISAPISQKIFDLLYDIKGDVIFFKVKVVNVINSNILQDLTNEFGRKVVKYKLNQHINEIEAYFDDKTFNMSKLYGTIMIGKAEYYFAQKDAIKGNIYTDTEYDTWFVAPETKIIVSDLDEELDDKFEDMSEEDIIRVLEKLKQKKLNINVLKLAFPEINIQKNDLLKKLREGNPNIV